MKHGPRSGIARIWHHFLTSVSSLKHFHQLSYCWSLQFVILSTHLLPIFSKYLVRMTCVVLAALINAMLVFYSLTLYVSFVAIVCYSLLYLLSAQTTCQVLLHPHCESEVSTQRIPISYTPARSAKAHTNCYRFLSTKSITQCRAHHPRGSR